VKVKSIFQNIYLKQ